MRTAEVHRRYAHLWDAYFLSVAVVVDGASLLWDGQPLPRRFVAAGAVAVMIALYATLGRRMLRGAAEDLPATLLLVGLIAFFAVAAAAVPFTTWLLFAMIPLIFQLAALRMAIVLIVVVNALIPVLDMLTGRWDSLLMDSLIALISTATGIWLGFWIIRVIQQNVERGQLIEELEASRAEVARLSHETGVAAERARLAGEIHDTLAQGFTSIITLLQAADPELRDERLALAVRTAKENLAESRALVAALAPAALAEEGSLPDAVRRQAARFAEETGTPATVRVTGDERALPTLVEVVLLRATQEALTNVRRHAAANETAVLLAYAPGSVRLVVRDDGHGFDPAVVDGFGLNGMRARAEQVDGALTVRSDASDGTTIELEVPA